MPPDHGESLALILIVAGVALTALLCGIGIFLRNRGKLPRGGARIVWAMLTIAPLAAGVITYWIGLV